jgi:dsRNA-specific ribonuclease
MDNEEIRRDDLAGFMANQETENNFKEYIRKLLSTFMSDKHMAIYMSEEVKRVVKRPTETYGPTEPDDRPAGVSEQGDAMLGPFHIIRRAFMHKYVSTISLENLETLGDVVLNEAAVMIITTNWPNLLHEAGRVADMKSYYTNNTNIAQYAHDLGFIRWIVRTKDQGLGSKERADVFESFVGAIVMIGEFFIGEQVGLMLARIFLNKFFATRKWYPEDPYFYSAPQNLWNDFKTSLPTEAKDKPFITPKTKEPYATRNDKGFWIMSITVQDPEHMKEKGEIQKRLGVPFKKYTVSSRNKDDGKTELYQNLMKDLKLDRSDINKQRESKRAQNPSLSASMQRLKKWSETQKSTYQKHRIFEVPAPQKRGGKTFVFIREIKKEVVGSRNFASRELIYGKTVASGIGDSEEEALETAIKALEMKREFLSIPGTDESHIWNPDQEVITLESSRRGREFTPKSEHEEDNRGSGRGKGSVGRGRGDKSSKSLIVQKKQSGNNLEDDIF